MSQKKKPRQSAKQYIIAARRAKVASLLLSGRKQREIAAALKVSLGTVNADLKVLMQEWQKTQLHAVDTAKVLDLKRIDAALAPIWLKVTNGDLAAIDRLISLIHLRKKILGYATHTTDVTIDMPPISVIEVIKDYGPPKQSSTDFDPPR
jgi:hypothetical protein